MIILWSHPEEKRIDHYQVDVEGCPTRSVQDLSIIINLCTNSTTQSLSVVAVDICNETSQPAMANITSMLSSSNDPDDNSLSL